MFLCVICASDAIHRNIVRVPVAFVRNKLQQFQHPWPHICLHKAVDLYRSFTKLRLNVVGGCHLFIDNAHTMIDLSLQWIYLFSFTQLPDKIMPASCTPLAFYVVAHTWLLF